MKQSFQTTLTTDVIESSRKIFPSEVDLLGGRRPGVHSSEDVGLVLSLMGNTLYRKKEREVKNGD